VSGKRTAIHAISRARTQARSLRTQAAETRPPIAATRGKKSALRCVAHPLLWEADEAKVGPNPRYAPSPTPHPLRSTSRRRRKPPMKISLRRTHPILRDTRGASMVEYVIVIGLVAFLAIAGFTIFGNSITTKVGGQANTVNGIPQ
jgi:pilus assembly protein Flp/PilA